MTTADKVERAVWGTLNNYRWFGKHVEDEQMEHLQRALRSAIEDAVQPPVQMIPNFPGDTGGIGGAGFDWNHS